MTITQNTTTQKNTKMEENTMTITQNPFNGKFNANELVNKTGKITLAIEPPAPRQLAQIMHAKLWETWRISLDEAIIRITLEETEPTEPTAKNQASFAKRYRQAWTQNIRKRYDIKFNIPSDAYGTIGQLHAELTKTGEKTVYYRLTDDIQGVGDSYYHPDTGETHPSYGNPSYSCWWGGYEHSTHNLEYAGGLGLLVYTEPEMKDHQGVARLWIVTDDNGYLIGFNPYANIPGIVSYSTGTDQKMDRVFKPILAQILGLTGSIDDYYFSCPSTDINNSEGMYVNDSVGFCIRHKDADTRPTFYLDDLPQGSHRCEHCSDWVDEDDCYLDDDGNPYCEYCFNELFTYCEHCGDTVWREDATWIDGNSYCTWCRDNRFTRCDHCDDWIDNNDLLHLDGNSYCPPCYDDIVSICTRCGDTHHCDNMHRVHRAYCVDCASELPEVFIRFKTTGEDVTPTRQGVRLLDIDDLPSQDFLTPMVNRANINPAHILAVEFIASGTAEIVHRIPWTQPLTDCLID